MNKESFQYQELLDIIKSMTCKNDLIPFFLSACENKNLEVCQLCLDNGFDINTKSKKEPYMTLFEEFINSDKFSIEIAEWLIEHGADIKNYIFHSGLTIACYKGNYEMAKFFIDKGVEIKQKTDDGYPSDLYYAVVGGNYEIVKMLIDLGAIIDENIHPYKNPYYKAIQGHKHKIVELLLKMGINADGTFTNFPGYSLTALHSAVFSNDIKLAEILLKYNANVNAEIKEYHRVIGDAYFVTPMDIALIRNYKDMQKLLLSFGGRASSDKSEKAKASKRVLLKKEC